MIGVSYTVGLYGFPKDFLKAYEFHEQAKNQGDEKATAKMERLAEWIGDSYYWGNNGLEEDTDKALEWYQKAPKSQEIQKKISRIKAGF